MFQYFKRFSGNIESFEHTGSKTSGNGTLLDLETSGQKVCHPVLIIKIALMILLAVFNNFEYNTFQKISDYLIMNSF